MIRSRKRTGMPRRLLPVLAAGVVAVAACEGPNAFQGPIGTGGSGSGRAPVIEILQPRGDSLAAKPLGDSVLIRAEASDDLGLDSVVFFGATLRGDVNLGTDTVVLRFDPKKVVLAGVRDTTLSRFIVPTGDTTRETTLLVAVAYDEEGLSSADTVSLVLGGPDVQILNLTSGEQLLAGLNLNLSAIAQDPQGLNRVEFVLQGVIDQTLVRTFGNGPDSVRVDTTVALPAGTAGSLSLTVRAENTLGVTGADGPVTVQVVASGGGDTIPPTVSVQASALPALELTDSVFLTVSGSDNAQGTGVARASYTVRAISPRRGDTLTVVDQASYSPPRTGTVSQPFAFRVFNVDSLGLPDTLQYEVTATLTDAAGNVSAPATLTLGREHVAGRTVTLPQGGTVLDAVVDTARRNMFLSNIDVGQLEVFRLDDEEFGTAIGVGSQPLGMDISRDGDSLWVANAGGTNFSVVDLGLEREVDNDRFFTPVVSLFDVQLSDNNAGIQYVVFTLPTGNPGFTDRGQYMAVDSFGNIIYSTETTLLGDFGTARKAFQPVGLPQSEVKLFVEHGVTTPSEDFWALAHIDSIKTSVRTDTVIQPNPDMTIDTFVINSAQVTFYDHVPGDESQVITGDASTAMFETPTDAWVELVAAGSDAAIVEGARWNIPSLGFSDTTYVARSGDRGWVLIGEGATDEVARVIMYSAREDEEVALSGIIQVLDFLQNTSVPVRGIGVNYDGTLSVARADEAYFFDERLRLQGNVPIDNAAASQGATLHPLHANAPGRENPGGAYSPDTHLAFIGGGDGTIQIIDTQRFRTIGEVTIRDVITGPLKAILPFPEDNAGRTCSTLPIFDRDGDFLGDAVQLYEGGAFQSPIAPDGITSDDCVVAKVFAVTSAGGVVVVPVRKADILRNHPAR
jgi:hypothetical protein